VTGVDEIHPLRVDPLHEENLGAAYRLHRARLPLANAMYERGVNAAANARFATVDQKRRRKTLGNVTRRRANLGERADMDSVNAALADLSARAALNAANAMAIAAIGERLYEIMETNS
jgi:CRISPR/Cas system CSM-associated protein Csm2 small subunit